MATAFVVAPTGCSYLFDAPTTDGVQVVKSRGQVPVDCDPAPANSSSVLDLRDGNKSSLKEGSQVGRGNGRTILTSRDAIRDLKARRPKSAAESRLLSGISFYERESVTRAGKVLDQDLVDNLGKPADRAVAYMYRAFVRCYRREKSACAQQFRHMYTVMPSFQVSEKGPGYTQWGPVLREVTAETRTRVAEPEATAPMKQRYARLLVSNTPDGSTKLLLNTDPGGAIMFDGKLVGESPPIRVLMVNPGTHSLLISGRPGERLSIDVDIAGGEQVEIRHEIQ